MKVIRMKIRVYEKYVLAKSLGRFSGCHPEPQAKDPGCGQD
jgi:hypothetical protein